MSTFAVLFLFSAKESTQAWTRRSASRDVGRSGFKRCCRRTVRSGISLCSLRYESPPAGAVPCPLLLLVFRSRARVCAYAYACGHVTVCTITPCPPARICKWFETIVR